MSIERIYIGTSGYFYSDWIGKFYPTQLKPADFLPYYAERFNAVEINMTFYRTPFRNVVISWDRKTPDEFCFVCKASRYITHIQRLKTSIESLDRFFAPLAGLGNKLRCILWQLPPNLKYERSLFKNFLLLINQHDKARDYLHCMEFRNATWFIDEVYRLLNEAHVGLCWYDAPKDSFPETPVVSTGNIIYLRFHGKKELYKGSYTEKELAVWVDRINTMKGIKNCFVFFNNDYNADGAFDAIEFKNLLVC